MRYMDLAEQGAGLPGLSRTHSLIQSARLGMASWCEKRLLFGICDPSEGVEGMLSEGAVLVSSLVTPIKDEESGAKTILSV